MSGKRRWGGLGYPSSGRKDPKNAYDLFLRHMEDNKKALELCLVERIEELDDKEIS